MLEKIKNFFVGAAKFVYTVTIQPIVDLRFFFYTEGVLAKVGMILDAASRVILIGSLFFAVPAILVTLAWAYIAAQFVVTALYVTFMMGTVIAGMNAVAASQEKAAAEAMAANDAATPAAA